MQCVVKNWDLMKAKKANVSHDRMTWAIEYVYSTAQSLFNYDKAVQSKDYAVPIDIDLAREVGWPLLLHAAWFPFFGGPVWMWMQQEATTSAATRIPSMAGTRLLPCTAVLLVSHMSAAGVLELLQSLQLNQND